MQIQKLVKSSLLNNNYGAAPRISYAMRSAVKGIFKSIGLEVIRSPVKRRNTDVVEYLHISKTAGTEISRIAHKFNNSQSSIYIRCHPHHILLNHLLPGAKYFFSIRNPISRFVSGFHCRQRKGQPVYYTPWSEHEKLVLATFNEPNALAEALFTDSPLGLKAFSAMKSLNHASFDQAMSIQNAGNFLKLAPPVWIIRQEYFSQDITNLFNRLGVTYQPTISNSNTSPYRTEDGVGSKLSDLAVKNLERWYAQDIEFYRLCEDWILKQDLHSFTHNRLNGI